mgnify:CR=1 FL=1
MKKLSREIWIVGAKRTPFGGFSGSLKDISAIDLAVIASKAALAQSGLSIESYLAGTGRDMESLFAELEQSARDDLRRELCLLALAEELEIAVGEDDLRAEISEHATHSGEDPEETFRRIAATGRLDMLRGELLIQRTIDHLIDTVKAVAVDLPVGPSSSDASASEDAS